VTRCVAVCVVVCVALCCISRGASPSPAALPAQSACSVAVCGAVYGAVCGAVYGAVCGAVYGAMCGAVCGAVCVAVYGAVCVAACVAVCVAACVAVCAAVCAVASQEIHHLCQLLFQRSPLAVLRFESLEHDTAHNSRIRTAAAAASHFCWYTSRSAR